jgi:hypothetical protein
MNSKGLFRVGVLQKNYCCFSLVEDLESMERERIRTVGGSTYP